VPILQPVYSFGMDEASPAACLRDLAAKCRRRASAISDADAAAALSEMAVEFERMARGLDPTISAGRPVRN
jgi:hypothetical protein